MYLWIFFKHREQPLSVSKTVAKRILKGCSPFILANIMVVIYGQIDRVMIRFLLNSITEVGLYSAALAICGIIGIIPGAILDSGRPLIVEAKAKSEALYQLRTRQLFAAILWVCLIYSIIITIFSKNVILILYGNEYATATTSLRIAVWYTAFSYLGSARSIWLICEKKNRYVFIFSVMGALTNVILNYVLIPLFGINGAAIATLITQILTNLIYPSFFKVTRSYSQCATDALLLRNIKLKETIQSIKAQVTSMEKI
jgi:O-antigen/teichoic acid export membrane protein